MTNFDMSRYDVKSIASSNLPIGGMSGKSKTSSESVSDSKSIDGGSRSADDLSSTSSVTTFASPPASSSLSFAIPIKQDPSDYWSNIFGFHSQSAKNNHPSTTLAPTTLFHTSSSPVPFTVDFSANSNTNSVSAESNNGFFNASSTAGYATAQQQQQQQQSSVSVSVSGSGSTATQIALNSNNSNSYETSSAFGNWVGPTLHTFQTHAKPNLFQTLIFGME